MLHIKTWKRSTHGSQPVHQSSLKNSIHTLSVSQYVAVVNDLLVSGMPPGTFEIDGEVSSYSVSANKWVRFDLKDGDALVGCFASVWQLNEQIADGMKIAVIGYGSIYARFGKFTLNIQSVRLSGEGSLKRAFELLKKKLEVEGLFDSARKRALPQFPARVALVTSRDAAAFTDFLRVSSTRWPAAEIFHMHVGVQGDAAVADVVSAITSVGSQPDQFDLMVVTRGGGSLEDLHVFNTEAVARACFASRIPVVSAIGHERDVTILDLVADVRAATQSNAAEIIFPDQDEIKALIRQMAITQTRAVDRRIAYERARTALITRAADQWIGSLTQKTQFARQRLVAHGERLTQRVTSRRESVVSAVRLLKSLHPQEILKRGYSYTRAADGAIIGTAAALRTRKHATQVYHDGEVTIEATI